MTLSVLGPLLASLAAWKHWRFPGDFRITFSMDIAKIVNAAIDRQPVR